MCKNGLVSLDDIARYVREWHGIDSHTALPEYLGMAVE